MIIIIMVGIMILMINFADNHRDDLKMLIWWWFYLPGCPDEWVEGQGPQAQREQVGNDDHRDHDLAFDYNMIMMIMIDLLMIEWEQDTGRLMILWWWTYAQLKLSAIIIIYTCWLLQTNKNVLERSFWIFFSSNGVAGQEEEVHLYEGQSKSANQICFD